MRRIDGKGAFADVARRLGGAPFSDLVAETGKLPRNADYVFKAWNVIAELKELEENLLGSLGLKRRIGEHIALWERQGIIRPSLGAPINLQDMPPERAHELTGMMKRKVEIKIAKSASDQIKATRRLLDMPAAFGLLILAHQGNRDMTPETLMHLMARSLGGSKHPEIDCILYMSPNVPITIAGKGPLLPWAPFCRSDRCMPAGFLDALRTEWMKLHQELTGEPISTIRAGGSDTFASMNRAK